MQIISRQNKDSNIYATVRDSGDNDNSHNMIK